MKSLLPLALLCLTAPAIAHPHMVEVSDEVEIVSFGMDAGAVEDLDVQDQSGNEVGEVEEVLGPDSATPEALAIEFETGDSLGDEERIVPLDQVTVTEEGVLMHGEVDLDSMPVWED